MKAIRILMAVSLVTVLAACSSSDNMSEDITNANDITETSSEETSYSMDDITTDEFSDLSAGTPANDSYQQDTSLGASSSGLGR